MEEQKKTIKRKTSSVKSAKKATTLSNDELLEQILNKKKTKKTVKEEVVLPKLNKQYVEKQLKDINTRIKDKNTSSDDLYDLLNEKKKLTKELNKLKTAEKKEAVKKTTTKKTTTKKTTAKKVTTKKTTTKKTTTKKVTPKKTTKKKTVAKKPTVKPVVPKPVVPEPVVEPEEELTKTRGIITKEKEVVKPEKQEITPEKKKELLPLFILLLLLALFVGFIVGASCFVKVNNNEEEKEVVDNKAKKEEEKAKELELLNKYNECLARPVNDIDLTEDVINAENELTNYLKKYKTSVGYEDIDIGFSYSYNENQVYYAASSVKVLTVLYLYDQASKGNINLDNTLLYTSKDKWSASRAMSKIKYNTRVKLRDLAKYAVTVSDNSAYQMLIKHLGKSKIKKFANDMGTKYTFVGGDNFGSINVHDGLIYWRAINEFISQDNQYAREFKSYVMSADQNAIALDEYAVQAAHKYGEYSPNFHDLGIMYSEHPYYIVVLTKEYGRNMLTVVNDISKHVYELHLSYYENREKVCKSEVYGI